ncbi:MAG TPA: hypothetical protein VMV18_05465, partial [bacterium]|nr:hypothetical protein [bacterium]
AGNATNCVGTVASGVEVLLVDGTVQSVSTGTCARAVAGANGTLYQLDANGTVAKVNLADGTLTPIVTSVDGITGSTLASDGANLYASATLSASGDSIAKIPLGGGAVNRDFLAIGAPATNAAVSGGRLWVRMGVSGLGSAALSGPPFASVNFVHFSSGTLGLEADGHGGVFFAETDTLYDVDTAGNAALVISGSPLALLNMATEPASGNVLVVGNGLGALLP